jgi:hypothetical protein
VAVNYSRVHPVGSAVIGTVIALAPTVLIYKVATIKLAAVIFILPRGNLSDLARSLGSETIY